MLLMLLLLVLPGYELKMRLISFLNLKAAGTVLGLDYNIILPKEGKRANNARRQDMAGCGLNHGAFYVKARSIV